MPEVAKKAPALVVAWHCGTMGGPGLVDVLLGRVNPSARLTASWPRAVSQVPVHYSQKNTGRPPKTDAAAPDGSPLDPTGFFSEAIQLQGQAVP